MACTSKSRLCHPSVKCFISDLRSNKEAGLNDETLKKSPFRVVNVNCKNKSINVSIMWLQGTVQQIDEISDMISINDGTDNALIMGSKKVPHGCPEIRKGQYIKVIGELRQIVPQVALKAMKIQELSNNPLSKEMWPLEVVDAYEHGHIL